MKAPSSGSALLLLALCSMLVAAALLSGCAKPVGVERLTPQEANQRLTENVLSDQSLSAPTQQMLNRAGLADRFREEPATAIESLRAGMPTASRPDRFFALAELSFLHATKGGDRSHYLAAAAYAYAFLFPSDRALVPESFDPRLMTAVTLYNQGLALGFAGKEFGSVDLRAGDFTMPFGKLAVRLDPQELRWGPFNMEEFLVASQLEVRGLRNDYRWPGMGAAMVASLKHVPGQSIQEFSLVPSILKVAATVFLRFEDVESGIERGSLTGDLILRTTQEGASIEVDGRTVPLEFRPTTALAYTLEKSQVYDFEIKGLLSGDLNLFKQSARFKDNVFLMTPFRPGRIPLVLVHGTASSPARWAEVLNEVLNDRELLDRYQIWLFTYNTGNPVLYSGGLLAHGLKNIVREFDPEGKDEALRKMVIIGHSQGGLLTKLTAIDSGNLFWDSVFSVPLEQLEVSPETRDLLQRSLYFKPLPFVERVVFISTPHRGSFLSTNYVSYLLQRVISLPFKLLSPLQEVFERSPSSLKVAGMKETIPRSTDNMNPESNFIKNFVMIPVVPAIGAHSIIAVNNPKDPQEEWNDGVVAYSSAHIEGVASERIVHSGHSAQDNPEAIEEIRRILIENLREPARN